MININLTKITKNEKMLKEIALSAQSPELSFYLIEQANNLLQKAYPYIPYNVNSNNANKHLRDLYQVSKPKKTKFKVLDVKYPSVKVDIRPRGKFKTYYAVVTAGRRMGKFLKYSNAAATPYPLENALKEEKPRIQEETINLILKRIERLDKNDKA